MTTWNDLNTPATPNLLEDIVEELWRDVQTVATRDELEQAVAEVSKMFQDVRVTAFVPIFIRRLTRERLVMRSREGGKTS